MATKTIYVVASNDFDLARHLCERLQRAKPGAYVPVSKKEMAILDTMKPIEVHTGISAFSDLTQEEAEQEIDILFE